MPIIVTGASGIKRDLSKLSKTIERSPKEIFKVVSEARNMIRKRTNKAQTASGGKFRKLNTVYAKRKLDKKKKPIPNLHWSGAMLRAMQVKKFNGGADIYFNDASERNKAEYHHFGRGVPRRSFFRLGKTIETYIYNQFKKPFQRLL